MPLIRVQVLHSIGSPPEPLAAISYDHGSTLHDFRGRLDRMQVIAGSYQFWCNILQSPIPGCLELNNVVSDYPEVVILLGSQQPRDGPRDVLPDSGSHSHVQGVDHAPGPVTSPRRNTNPSPEPPIPHDILQRQSISAEDPEFPIDVEVDIEVTRQSSAGSNEPQVFSPEELQYILEAPWFPAPKTIATSCEMQVVSDYSRKLHSSKLMRSDIQNEWDSGVRKLTIHYDSLDCKDQRWMSLTWDGTEDSANDILTPHAALLCLECKHSSVRSSGKLTKGGVQNCFNNWRNHHLTCVKHNDGVKRKRDVGKDAQDENVERLTKRPRDDRLAVELAVSIMHSVNASLGGTQEVFLFEGDLQSNPCMADKFSVICSFCNISFKLCPSQNTLRHNLTQHSNGQEHIRKLNRKVSALRTGNRGRPQKLDSRDRKQSNMLAYFKKPAGQSASISETSVDAANSQVSGELASPLFSDANPSLSLMCWGYRWNLHHNRDVKGLLHDRHLGSLWRPEPYTSGIVMNENGALFPFEGTFRHVHCSRISSLGGGFEGLICEYCHRIPFQTDFRKRVSREYQSEIPRGARDTGHGRRLDYLQGSELEHMATDLTLENKRLLRLSHRLGGTIARLRAHPPSLQTILGEAAMAGDVYKFCRSVISAAQTGAFGGKPALWSLLKDIVYNVSREKHGCRYSEETKAIMQALLQHGGRRVIECLAANIGGPSLGTLMRERRGMINFRSGLHVEQFKFVGSVLFDCKKDAGITGDIPVIIAEDETAVKMSIRWLQKHDVLVGFCGPVKDHCCQPGLEIPVGNRSECFRNIEDAFTNYAKGSHARVLMVNPLVKGFPRLFLLATNTCNNFNSEYVRQQWAEVRALWNEHCRSLVGPLIGHASDGDSRRRKLMLQSWTCTAGPGEVRNPVVWEGWSLSYFLVSSGLGFASDPYGLHDQDFIHNAKKGVNVLESTSRTLKLNVYLATLEHIATVFDLYPDEHGLKKEDVTRSDRQNWASAQRLCSRKVEQCLKKLRGCQDAHMEDCFGTEAYVSIIADYIDIFLDVRLTLRERIVRCAKVSYFFRLWRLWIKIGQDTYANRPQHVTMENLVSTQTFFDLQLSCHFVVALILLFRDRYPGLPVPIHLTGSDSCEQFFSKVGGMKGHERNFDFADLLDAARQLNRLGQLGQFRKLLNIASKKKFRNEWMRIHPLLSGESPADLSDYTCVGTKELVVAALKEGMEAAKRLCEKLCLCPRPDASNTEWFDTPWVAERSFKFPDCVANEVEDVADALVNRGEEDHVPVVPLVPVVPQESLEVPPECIEPSSNSSTVEWDDHVSDDVVVVGELHHSLGEIFSEVVQDPIVYSTGVNANCAVDAHVEYEGRVMWKGTVVSTYNGNPHLSKDRLLKVRQSFFYNSLTEKRISDPTADSMLVVRGSICGVCFMMPMTNTVVTPKTRGRIGGRIGQGKGKKAGKAIVTDVQVEEKKWYLGKVQKIHRKFGKQWGRAREPVDLLDPPRPTAGQKEPVTKVLFTYFQQIGKKPGKYTYENVERHQWVDLACVLSVVTMTVSDSPQPGKPLVWTLDRDHLRILDERLATFDPTSQD